MFYLYTKTEKEISKENLFTEKVDENLLAFDRKSPINERRGIVVMASANNEIDLNEKKRIIIKNLEREKC